MRRLVFLVIAATVLVIGACGDDEGDGTPKRSGTTLEPTGTVIAAIDTFENELLAPGQGSNSLVRYWGAMYDFFIFPDLEGRPTKTLGALRDWEMSSDAKTWTLTLRDGMRWHDGVDVTAVDGKFSMDRYAQDDASCALCGILSGNLDFAEVVDNFVFKVHFIKPELFLDAALIPLQGDLPIIPKHHWDAVGGLEAINAGDPLGSGPDKFVDRRLGEFIEYEANTDYWNPDRIPGFKTLRLLQIPPESSRLALVKRGDADMANMTPESIPDIKDAGLRVLGAQDTWVTYIGFAQSWDPNFATNDIRVRKAMALAINRPAVAAAVYPEGAARPYDWVITPSQEGFDDTLEPYPYDPAEARRLLEESGHLGLEVTIHQWSAPNVPETPLTHQAAAGFLQAAGFNPKLIVLDIAAFLPDIQNGTLDCCTHLSQWNWLSSSSLSNNMRVLMVSADAGGLISGFPNPEIMDPLFEEYLGEIDDTKREEIAKQINRLMHESYAYIPIAFKNDIWAVGPRVGQWLPVKGTGMHPAFETLRPVP